MTLLSRYLPAFCLSLILVLVSALNAYAMGPQRGADGIFVICNGSGLVTVVLGTKHDAPTLEVSCPDCLPVDHADCGLRQPDLTSPLAFESLLRRFDCASTACERNRFGYLSRAPPIV